MIDDLAGSKLLSTVIPFSMAETGSYNLGFRLDVKQILIEARHRWLRPAEICEILRNYQKFHISAEAPNKPVSGSVFLFDRKVLRYFRKDGHNWRKKKDGKTVKEAHEKLKVGSVDMLHCYYAHGEDNANFQRRSYWLLEPDLMHIVFVHYLEVKQGNKTNLSSITNIDAPVSNSEINSLLSSSFHGTSPSSTLSSAYEDAESGLSVEDNQQVSSRFHSYPESPLTDESHYAQSSSYNPLSSPANENASGLGCTSLSRGHIDGNLGVGSFKSEVQTTNDMAPLPEALQNYSAGDVAYRQETGCFLPIQAKWEKEQFEQRNLQTLLIDSETGNATNPDMEDFITQVGDGNYPVLKNPLINGFQDVESLKKVDSFSRWIARELGETDELNLQSSNGMSWSIMGNDYDSSMPVQLQVDTDTLNPSISQDQLFSINDFSPNWTYANLESKVLITGTFLRSEHDLSNCRWSIMFGQEEVTAEVLADGILCCQAPPHKPGIVPLYVTCSNRLACSEIREFEYRLFPDEIGSRDAHGDSVIMMHLYHRFETILSLGPIDNRASSGDHDFDKQNVLGKILSLKEESNLERKLTSEKDTAALKEIGELLLEKQLKEKFFSWLLQRITEDGKGLSVLDEGGLGVLHLAAALGFNWALKPILVSGISIDFRDVTGWTALHWAAYYGREDTVAALVSLVATPGALTDPSAEYPLGRTPADLAYSTGHKGISGFLAETSLTKHLSTLEVSDPREDGSSEVSGAKAIQTVSERLAVPITEADVPDTLSLKDSLAAVCNATQAAARIHQIFRVQSFQRKQFTEHDGDELLIPDEQAISFVAAKSSRLGHSSGMAIAAAVHIQKKFRGWKKRKEFLLIREKVVKIQAHFRGHQVRKKYKPIVWSVGILEKVILRWRRKGSGLRGFRSDAVLKGPEMQDASPQEDDYDFLKEGRKQTEERMHKALARVKSMTQYPEARAQYRRLLTAAESFRDTKDSPDVAPANIEEITYSEEELIDIESLLDDDTFMSLTFD